MSSPQPEDALVVLTEDLQREVDAVQHLRKVLHDAYIVESQETTGKIPSAPPSAVEMHRTLDAPTLALLKAPNYPFLLCEGAPPAYVPPPVPYDVEGEVENMKAKVLQVQRDLVAFHEKQKRQHAAKPVSKDPEAVKAAMREELVDFLDGHQLFSELSWQVSSLEWFYRWVLSHSISHLWNAKDQLEFVMTENGQPLPESAEAMDEALEQCPFTQAVAILDNDRQSVIAQERRRLRSVSRTFRDRLPPTAITAATSCYLSSEEKYMYQEFFNQSEHLLLLLDHTVLMERSATMGTGARNSRARSSTGGDAAAANGTSGSRSPQRPSGDGAESNANALIQQPVTAGEVANLDGLTQEALAAYQAEHEVIRSLMETIQQRRRDGIQFRVTEDEYQRSRLAQTAVYGCVVSDMNLMAQQMAVAKEFIDKYEDWIRFHGFDTHDGLMQLLVERSGGSTWPFLNMAGAGSCDGEHTAFTPPTAVWAQERSQPRPEGSSARQPSAPLSGSAPRPKQAQATPGSSANRTNGPLSIATPPSSASLARQPSSSAARPSTPGSPSARSPEAIADVYYTILRHADDRLSEINNQRAIDGIGTDDRAAPAPPRLERMWMAACMRETVMRLAQSRWAASWFLNAMEEIETELTRRLRQRVSYDRLVPNACALLVMVKELLTLTRKTASTSRSDMTEVAVALHSSRSGGEDLKQEVVFALTPVEYERWGAVLDALWFQADPSGAANGGLLLSPDVTSANPSLPGFQRIEKIALPVVAAPGTSATNQQAVPTVTLYYRAQTTATPTPAQLPATSVAATLQKESATFAARAATGPGGRATNKDTAAQCARRYRFARAALAALYEVEAKGLLPCYACRISECEDLPLDKAIFFSNPQSASSVVGVSVGLLPPGAVQLLRIYNHTGLRRAVNERSTPFDIYASEGVSFSSIGILISTLLASIATACRPVLKDLYMTAESTLEQANWERKNNVVPKSFVNATTQPTAMACAAMKARAISIQREASVPNRNSISLRRFISPLLRHMDDYLTTVDFAKVAADDDESFAAAPAASPPASASTRKTDLYSGGAGRTNASPSPSAVRPR